MLPSYSQIGIETDGCNSFTLRTLNLETSSVRRRSQRQPERERSSTSVPVCEHNWLQILSDWIIRAGFATTSSPDFRTVESTARKLAINMGPAITVIVNDTQQPLKLKVGNHLHFADLTTVEIGGKHTIQIDSNATYHEYLMGADDQGNKLIVSSDDLCDNKCITIKEVQDGKFDVIRESRQAVTSPTIKKSKSLWKLWT